MKDLSKTVDHKIASIWKWIFESVFLSANSGFSSGQLWFQRLCILGLYLIGIGVWIVFLNYGRIHWGVMDWVFEWQYSRILKEALTTGQLPLHTTLPVEYSATRFLGIPDVNLGPQMLLLRYFDMGVSFVINLLMMFTLSYVGCLWIRSIYKFSIFSFTIFVLLFNFNGFITSNMGIGHTVFIGYFLLPFFLLLILQLIEGKAKANWFVHMGIFLFGIELVGATQFYAQCTIFLGVLFLFASNYRAQLFKAILAGIVLNIYRIAPAFITLETFSKTPFAGFRSLGDLLSSMIWINPPSLSLFGLPTLWVEFDNYTGVIGFAFLALFGLYLTWKPQKDERINEHRRSLGWAMLVFSTLSIGYIYRPINFLPIPLFKLIHVPSRFFILPLILTIALASIRFQSWLDERESQPWFYFLLMILMAILGHDLVTHARTWRVELVSKAYTERALNYGLHIANKFDPTYTNTLLLASLFSLIALGYILFILFKSRVRSRKGQDTATVLTE